MGTKSYAIEMAEIICKGNLDFFLHHKKRTKRIRFILNGNLTNEQKAQNLFSPVMTYFSHQAIRDNNVSKYIETHGEISYKQISNSMMQDQNGWSDKCNKLTHFNAFTGCGYSKSKNTCNNIELMKKCPVPMHNLRNGNLNQKAYSLYLFIRDVCSNDIIAFIDSIADKHLFSYPYTSTDVIATRDELVFEFAKIYGVGNKLASMTLSNLLMCDRRRTRWNRIGQAMIAVDGLVHNFLHRTGILRLYASEHKYGNKCAELCVKTIDNLAHAIDARQFDEKYPQYFPMFVRNSIWSFCSESGRNICSKKPNPITGSCKQQGVCPIYESCPKIAL
jgi:hypothetical protein